MSDAMDKLRERIEVLESLVIPEDKKGDLKKDALKKVSEKEGKE